MVFEDTERPTSRYLEVFHRHVSDFSLHLSGSESGRSREQLKPTFYPPAEFWTTDEKNTFFHSICRHSRFRPDLIAADLPGKTIADVCVYLDLLAKAAEDAPKLRQSLSKPAYESTNDWIEFEEKQAACLCSVEAQRGAEERAARRERQLEGKRKAMTRVFGVRQAPEVYREEYKRINKAMKDDQERLKLEWAQEDSTRELDVSKLKALDYISLEAERIRAKIENGTSSGCGATGSVPDTGEVQEDDVAVLSLSPASRRRYTKKMYMRRKRAEKTGRPVPTSFARPNGHASSSTTRESGPSLPRSQSATLLKEFATKGIDADFLNTRGLSLFNLQAIGELTELYAHSRGETPLPTMTIALPTLQILYAEVRHFLTWVILRTITLHEQERVMKADSAFWGKAKAQTSKVKASTVQQALASIEAQNSKDPFFADFTSRLDDFMACEGWGESADEVSSSGGDNEQSENEFEGQGSDSVDEHDRERMNIDGCGLAVFPQTIGGVSVPLLWHSSLDYIEANPFTAAVDEVVDDSVEDEEEAHQAELVADSKLNEADERADTESQSRLWDEIRGHMFNTNKDITKGTAKPGQVGLRLLEPGVLPGIKSSVYIDDSD